MAITVSRREHSLARHAGQTTLEQRFRFEGPGADAAAIGSVLLNAPLVGGDSIFGDRPGEEAPSTEGQRSLYGFSPAPGFRFDVDIKERSPGVFLVRFAQPGRRVPYLAGDLLWTVADESGAVVFREQINTAETIDAGLQPLAGGKPSLRRWLFFRLGHRQVMIGAMANIARLATERNT
ncbi:MAG: hypothetical protein QNJ77_13470 [Acidimicrobiia bacterium]|nr:hypothetical protein [Acidimicrobiia bacterium]